MTFHDGAAGRAAVEVLIDEGKLSPDFWVRVEALRKDSEFSDDYEKREIQVAQAVRYAMGVAGVEMPKWGRVDEDAPNYVWIDPGFFKNYPISEPYYQARHLYWSMVWSHHAGNELADNLSKQDIKDREKLRDVAWISWKRLVPHFSEDFSKVVTEIENERGHNGHSFSKKHRVDSHVGGASIRDNALYEFYISQGDEGLKHIFHGIGQKAILGVGAMLFKYGEHDDLMPCVEKLENLLIKPKSKE